MFCVSLTRFHIDAPQVDLRYAETLGRAVIVARVWAKDQIGSNYMVEVWQGAYNVGYPVYWMTAKNH